MSTPLTARRERARDALRRREVDALVLGPSSDLAYLSGYRLTPGERLTCLVLPSEGTATLLVPRLEAPRAALAAPDLPIASWEETEDPLARLRELLGAPRRLAVADQMWSVFLMRMQRALPQVDFIPASALIRELRMRKDAEELAALRAVGAAADRAYARLREEVRFAGRREREVAADLSRILREEGHDAVAFCIVASGPNGASPHHETGDRAIEEGDIVVCDFGGPRAGYLSDITRTVVVGEGAPPEEVVRVHEVVRRAQEAGYAAARVGVPAEEVDRAARRVIVDAGYADAFPHRTGHGIGLDGHEHPYLVEGNGEPLDAGMTFSIEPGIYLEGRFGVRIEDIVALTPSGPERLNDADRSLARVR